jgi:dipeptidase D
MKDVLASLQPRSVWQHFSAIAAVPRPSKHEERISAWVRGLAKEHGYEVRADATGNLVLRVPASKGLERAPVVILQGHLDMVCEKNKDVTHDFMADPIRPRLDGEWVMATGTTLGADNGIGVAAALAAATDPDVRHGPLELLFTIDEETGLTGAQRLDPQLLEGRLLLNLDSEDDGKIFVGCAGGGDTHLFLDTPRRAAPRGKPYKLEVTGLRGGHSGLNIHENRGNALKLLTRVLLAALEAGIDFDLVHLQGGSKHNAIPREAEATLHLEPAAQARLAQLLSSMRQAFRTELEGIDDGLELHFGPTEAGSQAWAAADRDRLLRLLAALPHGVLGMSPAIPGLVETSSNLAVVEPDNGRVKIVTASRSSVMPTLRAVMGSIRAAGTLAGAQIEAHEGYPGWKPRMESPLLEVVRKVYEELWSRPPEVTAVHAGLECGLLGEKVPGLEMVSFGPQIEGAHSPAERVHVPSVARFWEALRRVLERLGEFPRTATGR